MNFLSFLPDLISLIIDLIDTDCEFLSLSQETLTHFKVNMTFLDYAGLKK